MTYTVNAYCMQHSETAPPSGHTYKSMTELDEGGDDKYLRKAIFYGYGGPGWGDTFNGHNIKKIMKDDYGCGSSETRAMQSTTSSTTCMTGNPVFRRRFVRQGEEDDQGGVKATLKDMPDPAGVSLTPGLSMKSTGAKTTHLNGTRIPAYKLTVTLESGVELVNDTTGKRYSDSGTVSGGQSFHPEATGNAANPEGKVSSISQLPL